MYLKIIVKDNKRAKEVKYNNKILDNDYKKIASLLSDLNNLGVVIDKAIKEYRKKDSDWDVAIGL